MKQKICFGIFAIAILSILLTAYFQSRPHYLSTNYMPPGSGSYDQYNNLNHPDNKERLIETLGVMVFNPIPGKSMMAIGRLGREGVLSKPALPQLEKVVAEYPNDQVQAYAQENIDIIKKALADAGE